MAATALSLQAELAALQAENAALRGRPLVSTRSLDRQLVIASYGGGRDSTAMLIDRVWRKEPVDVVLFANTGSERRETYEYLPIFDQWLRQHGYPGITQVNYAPLKAPYHTLEGNSVKNATLPGAAFNHHSCAMKFKVEPQQKWARHWAPARAAWAKGQKIVKLIGFEAGEEYRLKRADARAHGGKIDKAEAKRYEWQYPLIERGITLDGCIEIIQRAGLPVPIKSACYFCPFQKTEEVDNASPEDRARTILIELTAEPYNEKVRGLWRRPRKEDGRPGSITEYILQKGLSFTPLIQIAPQVVLNQKCQKARNGVTFQAPHHGPTLRSQLQAAGHAVPEVVLESDGGPEYQEDRRQASWLETEAHLQLVEAL